MEKIQLFKDKKIRTSWNAEEEKWYFSVVDVVGVLTDSLNPTDYLKKMRKRDPELSSFLGTNCPQVTMVSESGKKRKVLAADAKGILRIIQSITSSQVESFKLWLTWVSDDAKVRESVSNKLYIVDYQSNDLRKSNIESKIYTLRGSQIMLDSDLAELYDVETKALKQQVKRNRSRFPEDIMFELTKEEFDSLRPQNVTSNKRGGNQYLPFAFTETGVAMLSSVLTSEKAIIIKLAKKEIVLIDPYVDARTFDILEDREQNVTATIFTSRVTSALRNIKKLHDVQYPKRHIGLKQCATNFHDRFLIVDDDVYHFGASFKDLGQRLFAFEKMELDKNLIMSQLY